MMENQNSWPNGCQDSPNNNRVRGVITVDFEVNDDESETVCYVVPQCLGYSLIKAMLEQCPSLTVNLIKAKLY